MATFKISGIFSNLDALTYERHGWRSASAHMSPVSGIPEIRFSSGIDSSTSVQGWPNTWNHQNYLKLLSDLKGKNEIHQKLSPCTPNHFGQTPFRFAKGSAEADHLCCKGWRVNPGRQWLVRWTDFSKGMSILERVYIKILPNEQTEDLCLFEVGRGRVSTTASFIKVNLCSLHFTLFAPPS